MNDATALLELRDVSKRFERRLDLAGRMARGLGANLRESTVHAVDGVSLSVREGEVVGLVGESGCGKSTLGRMVARILDPSAGERLWRGRPYAQYEGSESHSERLAVQMIFQDPFASLNPRLRIVDIVGEAPVVHGLVPRREGAPEPIKHAPETRCPVLGLFGGADENILPEHIAAYERGLQAAGVEHEIVSYPGAPHSFFDRSFSEHAEACEDAWRRVLGFLQQVGASLAR